MIKPKSSKNFWLVPGRDEIYYKHKKLEEFLARPG